MESYKDSGADLALRSGRPAFATWEFGVGFLRQVSLIADVEGIQSCIKLSTMSTSELHVSARDEMLQGLLGAYRLAAW